MAKSSRANVSKTKSNKNEGIRLITHSSSFSGETLSGNPELSDMVISNLLKSEAENEKLRLTNSKIQRQIDLYDMVSVYAYVSVVINVFLSATSGLLVNLMTDNIHNKQPYSVYCWSLVFVSIAFVASNIAPIVMHHNNKRRVNDKEEQDKAI